MSDVLAGKSAKKRLEIRSQKAVAAICKYDALLLSLSLSLSLPISLSIYLSIYLCKISGRLGLLREDEKGYSENCNRNDEKCRFAKSNSKA